MLNRVNKRIPPRDFGSSSVPPGFPISVRLDQLVRSTDQPVRSTDSLSAHSDPIAHERVASSRHRVLSVGRATRVPWYVLFTRSVHTRRRLTAQTTDSPTDTVLSSLGVEYTWRALGAMQSLRYNT